MALACCATRCAAAMSECHHAMGRPPCPHCAEVVAARDPTLRARDVTAAVLIAAGLAPVTTDPQRPASLALARASTGPPAVFIPLASSPLRI